MRIYLDNCCYNRPFDDQVELRVRLETWAKLRIQERIVLGELELAWSYILDFENGANPFEVRRSAIASWKAKSVVDIDETPAVIAAASELLDLGVRSKDALHVACAVAAECRFFVTTDDRLRQRLLGYTRVEVIDPPSFVRLTEP